jgi:hypothetical protein
MRAPADYWATEYDWRPVEARLQALPQFVTEIEGEQVLSPRAGSKRLLGTGASGPPLATWTKTSVPPAHEREPARCSSRVVESLDRSSASRATREGDPTYSRVEKATTTPHATRTVPIIMSQYPGPSDTALLH